MHVFARNDTTVPIAISTLRFSGCSNLRISCAPFALERTVLPPRGYRSVLAVLPATAGKRPKFTVEAEWRVATECIDRDAGNSTGSMGGTAPAASPLMMILPPEHPMTLRGVRFTVEFFVNGSGNVDSLTVDGIPEQPYLSKLRSTMMKYRFTAPLLDGCPAPSRARFELELGL